MIPSVGRIVHYRLSGPDASAIVSQRAQRGTSGNSVREGDVFPAIITRTWFPTDTAADPQQACQLQVFLDGPDTLWVTSRQQAADPTNPNLPAFGSWIEPPRLQPASTAAGTA